MVHASNLDKIIQTTLTHCANYHPKRRPRQRAHAILLRSRGYTRLQLSELFEVQGDTITRWFRSWDQFGLAGLLDNPRPGRPMILTPQDCTRFVELIKAHPQSLTLAADQLSQETGKQPSLYTLKRVLKKRLPVETRPALVERATG